MNNSKRKDAKVLLSTLASTDLSLALVKAKKYIATESTAYNHFVHYAEKHHKLNIEFDQNEVSANDYVQQVNLLANVIVDLVDNLKDEDFITIKNGGAKTDTPGNLKTLFDENGAQLSPILPEEKKNFLIDIDGTICDDIPNEEPERMATAQHYPDALAIVNKWHSEEHIITFFTSRTEEHRLVTEKWLDDNHFKYHFLLMGKPRGGNYHWIDNHIVRATRFTGNFTDLVLLKKDIEVFK